MGTNQDELFPFIIPSLSLLVFLGFG